VNQPANGTITVSPNQPTYFYNDTPTITAAASSGYTFVGWVVTGNGSVAPSLTASQATLTVQGDVTLTASFRVTGTLHVVAVTPSAWVYQNTPTTTKDRHYLTLSMSVTDTLGVGNTSYVAAISLSGTGVVRPSSTFVATNGSGSVTPVTSVTLTGTTGKVYLVGGRVQGGGLVASAANVAVTGSCTVTLNVTGNVSGAATTSVTIFVRRLGDVNGNKSVQGNDATEIYKKVAGTPTLTIDPAGFDVDGNGSAQGNDATLIYRIVAGVAIP
jgi:uncharacterized repeat protein (TIGR02543 family)